MEEKTKRKMISPDVLRRLKKHFKWLILSSMYWRRIPFSPPSRSTGSSFCNLSNRRD